MSTAEERKYEWIDVMGDYSLVPVPEEALKSTTAIFFVFTGVLACIAALWGGAVLGLEYTLRDIIVVAIVGCLIQGIIGFLTSYMGAASRLSTYALMSWSYGRYGAFLWGLALAGITCGIGWYAVETWLFGIMTQDLIPNNPLTSVGVASIWGGLLMMTTTAIGITGIAFLSYLTVPFWIILVAVSFASGIMLGGGWEKVFTVQPVRPAPFEIGVAQVVGLYIAGATITPDITRFAKSRIGAGLAWFIQVMVVEVFFLVGSGILVLVMGGARITESLLAVGVGVGAYLLAILGQWTTNDVNLYSGALNFTLISPVNRRAIVIILGVLGTAIAAYVGFVAGASFDPFIAFLTFLGSFVPAVAGTLIADFYIYRGFYKRIPVTERYKLRIGDKIPEINLTGWISTAIGGVLGTWVITAGIPSLNSLLISLIIYSILAIVFDKAGVNLTIGKFEIREYGLAPKWIIRRVSETRKG
ncbi:cytosine permease [Thermofilum sp.]|uniref:cytosine permease n=1 Tax=Thermofilum sp. TaxID=1961369 RepID=UPI00316873C9